MKRNHGVLLAGAMLASLLLPAAGPAQTVTPMVRIDAGQLQGVADEGVTSWKGIPYAAPPVGDLRWRAPQPVTKWSGVRQANFVAPACMQGTRPGSANPPSEDCLYLNVWRPTDFKGRLPVIVWFHGGGYTSGSGTSFGGAGIAKLGVVSVALNFRLGRIGTFLHPQLKQAAADKGLIGNYGYLDMVAALKWVQRNIGAFGGDPGNVTIAGCSSGGAAVWSLTTSPMTKGLFVRSVAMSGGDIMDTRATIPSEAEQAALTFAEGRGIAPGDPQALAKLRAMPGVDLTAGLVVMQSDPVKGPRTATPPYADGRVGVDSGLAIRKGRYAHVPIMIGADDNDVGGRLGMMTDGGRKLSKALSAQGLPIYEYRFEYVPAADRARMAGAGHCSDNNYFFNNLTARPGAKPTPADIAVSNTMSAYLVNFARTGNPNGPGLPNWPRYAAKDDRLMVFGREGPVAAKKDPLAAELDALAKPKAPGGK